MTPGDRRASSRVGTQVAGAALDVRDGWEVQTMAEEPRGPVVREREVVREEPAYPPPPLEPQQREFVREQRYYVPPPPPPQTSSLALASLATGISAYFLFPIDGAIAAIVTGFLAQNEIRASHGRLTGSAFATAGLVLGWLQIGLIILFVILVAVFAAAAPGFSADLGALLGG